MDAETTKRKNLVFVFGSLAVIFGFTGLAFLRKSSQESGGEGLFFLTLATTLLLICGAVAFIGIITTASLALQEIKKRRGEREFLKTFECFPNPPNGLGCYKKWRQTVQNIVDSVLQTLAEKLDDAFRQEEETSRRTAEEITPFSKDEDIRLRKQALVKIRQIVQKQKEQFWNVHECASGQGFLVKKSHRDYLKKKGE